MRRFIVTLSSTRGGIEKIDQRSIEVGGGFFVGQVSGFREDRELALLELAA
jgi:hypothetical protein